MEEPKKSNRISLLIILLIMIILGLITYIAYDKVLKQNNSTTPSIKNDNTDSTNDKDENNNMVWSGTSFDLLEKADVDEKTNFQNKKLTIANTTFTLNCNSYEENICNGLNILINNTDNNIKISLEESTYFIITYDLFVISTGQYLGEMKLMDNAGNMIYEDEIVMSYRSTYDGFNDVDATPTLIEGKLYFYTQKNDNLINKNYLDFNNGFDLITIEEIEGYIGEY